MQVYQGLLKPCPEKPSSLSSFAFIQQTKEGGVLIDTSLQETVRYQCELHFE
jgi:hypothetical protein